MSADDSTWRAQPECLPWHEAVVHQLNASRQAERLPHALLICGIEGLGKKHLAAYVACSLMCETQQPALRFCGVCAGCALMKAGTHPDFHWICPQEDKQQISIDQIRLATDKLARTSARHGWKVALIEPAHQLTSNAANSLLKTLEEPTSNSVLMLVTSRPGMLPVTVRSRCQQIEIRPPAADLAQQWLAERAGTSIETELLTFCAGAPLSALDYAKDGSFRDFNQRMMRAVDDLLSQRADVTQIGQAWADDYLPQRLRWLDLWLSQRVRAWIAGTDELITFPQSGVPLPSGGPPLNISAVYEVIDRIRLLRVQLMRTALHRELAMESLLLELTNVLRTPDSICGGSRVT